MSLETGPRSQARSAAASRSATEIVCWHQVGLDRLAQNGGSSSTGDPTLNIDPSRNGVEPDVAFTGPNDTVAWVTWYEKDASQLGLRNNEQVFAAKIVADPTADGGFHWRAVGSGTAGPPVQVNPLVNAPFFPFTTAGSQQRLFGQAIVGGISCSLFPGCRVGVAQSRNGAEISSQLGEDDTVGILAQRIVRFTRVHGQRVPVLKLVGRVPLGKHHHVASPAHPVNLKLGRRLAIFLAKGLRRLV